MAAAMFLVDRSEADSLRQAKELVKQNERRNCNVDLLRGELPGR